KTACGPGSKRPPSVPKIDAAGRVCPKMRHDGDGVKWRKWSVSQLYRRLCKTIISASKETLLIAKGER
ncbi:MAG: hypothetical protein ACTHKR_06430, partial [Sphingomonas sp.]